MATTTVSRRVNWNSHTSHATHVQRFTRLLGFTVASGLIVGLCWYAGSHLPVSALLAFPGVFVGMFLGVMVTLIAFDRARVARRKMPLPPASLFADREVGK